MKQPLFALGMACLALFGAYQFVGYGPTYLIGYGAFTLMAAMISLTFFWLWARRATPLALGMGFGWAGAASVMGWWWSYKVLTRPEWMVESPVLFLFLSIYFTGAVLHFHVIARCFGWVGREYYLPIVLCISGSIAANLLI